MKYTKFEVSQISFHLKVYEEFRSIFVEYYITSKWGDDLFNICRGATRREGLSSLSSDSSCKLYVLWHNSDTLGVDSAQVGIFE